MRLTRRDWLCLIGQSPLWAQDNTSRAEIQRRIARIIRAYEEQGNHRTGTRVDQISGDWLATEVRQSGLKPVREAFKISRVEPAAAWLSVGGRRIEGVPLFDGSFTDSVGVSGRLGLLLSDTPIGLTEAPPNTAETGAIGEARRQNWHRAIIIVTRGERAGLCPNNAVSFLHPFGPPVLQITSDEATFLADLAQRGSEGTLVANATRTQGVI